MQVETTEAAALWVDINTLTPWGDNPRKNDGAAVDAVADSIKRFGFASPIIARKEDGQVIAGHTRLKAAQKLGIDLVPVRYLDLDPADAKLLAIADNKTGEVADWDEELLGKVLRELDELDLDLGDTAFDAGELDSLMNSESAAGDAYTAKVEAPIYEIKGEKPSEEELFDTDKTEELQSRIMDAELPEEVRTFLLCAAQRHTVFRYDRIAEDYAHAPSEVQSLMEDSALVIIDFDKAIEDGFVKLTSGLAEIFSEEQDG